MAFTKFWELLLDFNSFGNLSEKYRLESDKKQ
jgi:hypothetical protein